MTETLTVPRFTIDLAAPAEDRWRALLDIYAEPIRAVEAQINDLIKEHAAVTGAIVRSLASTATEAAVKLQKVMFADDLKAIATLTGVALGRVVAMQLVYEAAARCTAVVARGCAVNTAAGARAAAAPSGAVHPAHARTMDWEMEFLRPLTVELVFVHGGAPVFQCTTWAGYVGVLTGMSMRGSNQQPVRGPGASNSGDDDDDDVRDASQPPGAGCDAASTFEDFSVAVNFRCADTGTFWTNLKASLGGAWPIGFLVRETLQCADGYAQAVTWLQHSDVIAPTYVTVCGSLPGHGMLITRDRSSNEQPLELATAEHGVLAQANQDHWVTDPNSSILSSIERRNIVKRVFQKRRAENHVVDIEALWKILSVPPIHNDVTIYGTVMVPATGYYVTRLPWQDASPRRISGFVPRTLAEATRDRGVGGFHRCKRCTQLYDPALNSSGQCAHTKPWHGTYEDCSYVKCAVGLGPGSLGSQHWGCCFATDKDDLRCAKSAAHEMDETYGS